MVGPADAHLRHPRARRIESRDKVLPILRAVLAYYPHLQALSASSPFWGGKDTAYASNRA